jgi:hypothetical protein
MTLKTKPFYDGYTLKLPNSTGEIEDVGRLTARGNLMRLLCVKAFIYEAELGQVSVRLERKVRGSSAGYWVAYKRIRGKLRKRYICEAYALDPYVLDRAACYLLGYV